MLTCGRERRDRPGRPGFTLIELLAVIAIIGLLAGMLLPMLGRAKAKAQGVACLNNERQMGFACMLYCHDANDRMPYNVGFEEIGKWVARGRFLNWTSTVLNWETDPDNTNRWRLTQGGLGPYVSRAARVYQCPSDRVVSDLQAAAGWTERVRSLSMNMMMGNAGEYTRTGANVNNPNYRQFFKESEISQPAGLFVFIEEHPDSIDDGYFWDQAESYRWMNLPASWHNGAVNLSFADGHTETHKWRFASTRPPNRPDAAHLPFRIPWGERGDFDWLMDRMSTETASEAYPAASPTVGQ